MIYLTENGAFFERDFKELTEAACDAHVGAYNLFLNEEKIKQQKELDKARAEEALEYW